MSALGIAGAGMKSSFMHERSPAMTMRCTETASVRCMSSEANVTELTPGLGSVAGAGGSCCSCSGTIGASIKFPGEEERKKNAGRIKKLPLGNPMTARGTARKKKKKQKIKQLPFRHLPCAWTEGCGATIKNETFCAIPVTGAKCLWDFLWISSPSVQAPTSVVPTRMLMVVVLVEQLTVMTYLS